VSGDYYIEFAKGESAKVKALLDRIAEKTDDGAYQIWPPQVEVRSPLGKLAVVRDNPTWLEFRGNNILHLSYNAGMIGFAWAREIAWHLHRLFKVKRGGYDGLDVEWPETDCYPQIRAFNDHEKYPEMFAPYRSAQSTLKQASEKLFGE
jgi:hypothetical protein